MDRKIKNDVNELFVSRWSPRAFDKEYTVSDEDLMKVFEAAKWSPSAFNEQPWRFLYAKKDDEIFEQYTNLLVDANKDWAKNSSAIVFMASKKTFTKNGKDNSTHEFDSGSAWMALTLQARMMGLYTHGMAGIKKEDIYQNLNVPKEDFDIICGFAIGKQGDKSILSDEQQENEKMSPRKNLEEIIFNGHFKQGEKE